MTKKEVSSLNQPMGFLVQCITVVGRSHWTVLYTANQGGGYKYTWAHIGHYLTKHSNFYKHWFADPTSTGRYNTPGHYPLGLITMVLYMVVYSLMIIIVTNRDRRLDGWRLAFCLPLPLGHRVSVQQNYEVLWDNVIYWTYESVIWTLYYYTRYIAIR